MILNLQRTRNQPVGSYQIKMQKLQLVYDTWQRPDADGLYDYQQESDKRNGAFMIEENGFICRNKNDYSLLFTKGSQENVKFQPIIKVSKKAGRFVLSSLKVENQPLCKIVSDQNCQMYTLKKSDKLKLGKVEVQVVDLSFTKQKSGIYYQQAKVQLKDQKVNLVREITPSFYVKDDQSKAGDQSLIQDNPTCRYCYSKTVTLQNPFIVSCLCKGSSRYIHQQCLLQWLLKKGQLNEIKGKGIFFADAKIFKCEICHHFYYIPEIWKKIYHHQMTTLNNLTQPIFNEVLILHFKYEHESIYFIDLSKSNKISIGRALNNQIVINELSVSRQHAFIEIDSNKKQVTLKDNNSKFGTVAQCKIAQIQNNQTFQVGRSRIIFKLHKKKSFLQKLSIFCLAQEKLMMDKKQIQI